MSRHPSRDPFDELAAVQKRMNQLFESALARTNFETGGGFDTWTPVADVYETAEGVVVDVELPGVSRDSIDIRLDGPVLVVSGERTIEAGRVGEQYHRIERSHGKFSRRVPLRASVDPDRVAATYRDGLLKILLPPSAGPAGRARRVTID